MRITVLGAGAWGTAIAVSLSARHDTVLWGRDPAQCREIVSARRNQRYLPEIALPPQLAIEAGFAAAVSAAELVLVATPTAALRGILAWLAPLRKPVVWLCKGFEPESAALPHQIAAEVLAPGSVYGVLSGPSFALEVAREMPTALTLASADAGFSQATARALHGSRLRVYFSSDIVGVEIGAAVKNVMAIATGIADGLGLGANARAALITRGLAEITRLGVKLGGRPETFTGLTGAGDLILTCTGELSRNRRVGLGLAQGKKLDDILRELGHVAEGVYTAAAVEKRALQLGIDMPITQSVCAVLFGGVSPREAVEQLLARDPKGET
ncbi:MAG: glycerol-3-phosphate dehydrogenase [Betaproteobacteria bacterium RIFCSPLOWO2_12_FULL_64_23]|nr:MAG: glycerol-3-phosphate dehydrogenase [Betaproteobacteria bacterium RIFCSPLOWO2_12_FULL_64_23]